MQKFLSVYLMVAGIYVAPPVAAENLDQSPTSAELKLLPEYCQARWQYGDNRSSSAVEKWRALLGDDYEDIHHYCLGLNYVNRANRSWNNNKNMAYFLEKAEGNMTYMIEHTKQAFILRPEIYVQLGKVYARQGKVGDAVAQFQNAIQLRNDYWSSYAALSDLFKENNNRSEALRVVEEGLKYAPDSKGLKRRQQELSK